MASKTILSQFTKDTIYKAIEKTKEQFDAIVNGTFVLITEAKYELVIRFLRDNFVPYEPVAFALGLDKESPDFDFMFRPLLESNMSIALQDNITSEIIGVFVLNVAKADDELNLDIYENPKIRLYAEIIDITHDKGNVFKHYDIKEAVMFNQLAVGVEYRRRGIASLLTKAALHFVKNIGVDPIYITTEGSSNFSQKCLENNGFESLYEFQHGEYFKDGVRIISDTGIHKSVIVYGQYLV